MTLHILSKQDTVLNKFIAQIRDKSVQKDSMRFRRNLERSRRSSPIRPVSSRRLWAKRRSG